MFSCHSLKVGHHLGRGEPCLGHLSWRYLPTAPSCEMTVGKTHTFTCSSFLTFCRTSWWSPRKAISEVAALAVVSWPPNSSSVADSFSSLHRGQMRDKTGLEHSISIRPTLPPQRCTWLPDWSRHPGARTGVVPMLPVHMTPHPTACLQPLQPSALHKPVYFMGRGSTS